jgi:hypothetical protein
MEWDIAGIARFIMRDMQEDKADLSEVDYYTRRAFRSIQTKDTQNAGVVIEQVKQFIEDNYEE